MPTRYGGSALDGSVEYFAASHFAGSNFGLGNFRRPTMPVGSPGTPDTGGWSQASIQSPY
jgi:hypothetical protein